MQNKFAANQRSVVAIRLRLLISTIFLSTLLIGTTSIHANKSSSMLANQHELKLTLFDAAQRVLAKNPELQVFKWRFQSLQGQRISADQKPAYQLGFEAENLLGSGEYGGFDNAALTLSLSSIVELGGKLEARNKMVDSKYQLVEAHQQVQALDIIGELTQIFIETLSLQQKLLVAQDAKLLASDTLQIVENRANGGAAPQADVSRAKAGAALADLQYAELVTQIEINKVRLAALWGQKKPDFSELQGDLMHFQAATSFETLYQQLKKTPAIEVYASEKRLRETELLLAKSHSSDDIQWQAGVKRIEATNDTALAFGFSIPLSGKQRNRGEIIAAQAAISEAEANRETALLALHSRLYAAYHLRKFHLMAVTNLQKDILPTLTEALKHTRIAFERGRYSYLEWLSAQRELLDARMRLIDSATSLLQQQNLIEQLTGISVSGSAAVSAKL